MKDKFIYSFRFCCDPGHNDEREINSLVRFAKDAAIDDVSVFCNVEELNTGHMDYQEQETFLSLISRVQAAMEPLGISVSVNHWHSLMHADLGKQLRPGQDFDLMVDSEGRQSTLCICPLSENWLFYFQKLYQNYACLHPHILWVEDDFRLHNHAPLSWGGCFCEKHMAEYSRRAGRVLTRKEFVSGLLAPGDPHSFRKIWLDVSRESMRTLAVSIGSAVHAVAPQVKVGLMSSVPFVHSAEGRDWKGILNGFAGENPPVNRIHLPCYSEIAPKDYLMQFNMISMANRALIPENAEVYPELENYPYSLFAKSRRFTRFQILSALPLNLAGMTIDLFDLNGSGIIFGESYQQMLASIKPFLDRVTQRSFFAWEKQGVCILIDEKSSYTLHTSAGSSMEELYPHEVYFAAVLNAFGIPFRYCTDPGISGQFVAVSGQYFRNLTEDQIRSLFEDNFLILSGDAVSTLQEMGLAHLAGVRDTRWMQLDGGEYTFEEVTDGSPVNGITNARASSVISGTDVLAIEYEKPYHEMTAFFDSFHHRAAPGHVLVDGKVFIHPCGHMPAPNQIPPMQLNAVRQQLFQRAIREGNALSFPMVLGQAYLQPYFFTNGNKACLYLVNASHDDVEEITLYCSGMNVCGISRISTGSATGESVPFLCEGDTLKINTQIPALDVCMLIMDLS